MGTNYSPKVVTDGLVLYLDAANGRSYPGSGSEWFDLSKYGDYGLKFNSPEYNVDKFSFDGTNEAIRLTRSDISGGSFNYQEISCHIWLRPYESNGSVFSDNNIITVERSFEFAMGNRGNGYSNLYYASVPWSWVGVDDDVVKNEEWNFISYVHDFSSKRLMVNGETVYSRSYSGYVPAGDISYPYFYIMGRGCCGGRYAAGDVASVFLHNFAMTDPEVMGLFLSTRSRFGL
jgi:hypothetical protein